MTTRRWVAWLAATALPLAAGCSDADRPFFRERAAELGIDFVHFNGMTGEYYLSEIMGGGAALFDGDGDGDLDAYLVQGCSLGPDKTIADALLPPHGPLGTRDRLYRNELVESGTLRFRDVTATSGLDVDGYGMGVAAGDIDDDGDVDLYVTNFGPNRLYRNDGDLTFTDITEASGTGDTRWSASAAWFDYDRDGRLDLYVANYVDFTFANHKQCFSETSARDYCGPLSYKPVPGRLFRNLGGGRFEDVSAYSQIVREYGGALGVVTADFDGDGWIDVYVANDGLANQLWINQQDGRFRNVALEAGCAVNAAGKPEASMGVDAADFDGDGDEDLFMTHLTGETNTLYVNDGRGNFLDSTFASGLGIPSRPFTGFGTAFFDYDNDGWLDILTVNGAVKTEQAERRPDNPLPLGQSKQLFRNRGDGRFDEVSGRAGPALQVSEISRGAAFGDVDNDGDTDVLITNNSGPARLLMNEVGNRSSWLGLRLVDGARVRDQHGAVVVVTTTDGRVLHRRARADASYASANDPRVLVGLAAARGVRSIAVRWPSGRRELWDFAGEAIDRYITLVEGGGQPP